MAIQEQKIRQYCELCQEILVHSDVLVCATLLFHGLDAVHTSGRDRSMNERTYFQYRSLQLVIIHASSSDHLDCNLTGQLIHANQS